MTVNKQFEQMKKLTINVARGLTHFEQDFATCSYCGCSLDDFHSKSNNSIDEHDEECEMIIAQNILGDEWLEIKAEDELTRLKANEQNKLGVKHEN